MRAATLILLCVAVAARAVAFTNPVASLDEQFYLLVGGRLLHGAIPYVNIWDRKPIGLFLLYALFKLPGGSGVIASHSAAVIFVAATSVILFWMARRIASDGSALTAAAIYIVWLNLAGGETAQAPIFYNLLMAAAVAILLTYKSRAVINKGNLRSGGCWAMLLCGVSLQIKYSVVFEGLFIGITLISVSWRAGRGKRDLAIDAALWISIAALPTIAAGAAYALIGHFHDWVFANITSIALRGTELPTTTKSRIIIIAALIAPLLLTIPVRRWCEIRPVAEDARRDLSLLDGWSASALLGVVLFGTWFNHYALPLFAPLAVSAAPLGGSRFGRFYLAGLLLIGGSAGQYVSYQHGVNHGNGRDLAAAVDALKGSKTCIFVYDGYPALYDATSSCLLTTRPFPSHLHSLNEGGATGIVQVQEIRRIMASRPERVVTMEPAYAEENPASREEVYGVLRREYVELYRSHVGAHQLVVFALRKTQPSWQKQGTKVPPKREEIAHGQ